MTLEGACSSRPATETQQGRQDFWKSLAGMVIAVPQGLGKSQVIIIPNFIRTERKSGNEMTLFKFFFAKTHSARLYSVILYVQNR